MKSYLSATTYVEETISRSKLNQANILGVNHTTFFSALFTLSHNLSSLKHFHRQNTPDQTQDPSESCIGQLVQEAQTQDKPAPIG